MDLAIILNIQTADKIAIANIIVTAFIGIWIGFFLQKNFTTIRAVKDYFVNENQDIKSKYSLILDDLLQSRLDAKRIQEWFKIMTIKIDIYENFIKKEFDLNTDLLYNHNKLKRFITGSIDLNSQYHSQSVILSFETKTELLKQYNELSIILTKLVIELNKAKKRTCFSTLINKILIL